MTAFWRAVRWPLIVACAAVGIGVATMLDRTASRDWASKSPLRPDEPELACTHDVQYLDLADYLWLAGAALDRAPEAVFEVADLGLAESALHAPAAGFGGSGRNGRPLRRSGASPSLRSGYNILR